jgi:hypothetical protein
MLIFDLLVIGDFRLEIEGAFAACLRPLHVNPLINPQSTITNHQQINNH